MINEYKNIKDNYSWDDDFEFESDPAKGQIHQKSMIFGFLRRNQEKQKCIQTTSLTSFSIFPKTTSKHKPKKLWIQNLQNLTLQAKLFHCFRKIQRSLLWTGSYWMNPPVISIPKQVQLIKLKDMEY